MQGQITLVGMMGVGKTAVGQEIARQLNVPFVDSDAEIERAAGMNISEIFARDGEDFFRNRESRVISRILSGVFGVVSTGGGVWIQEHNQKLIREAGVSVWLMADLPTLWQRVRQRPTRPLLMTENPQDTLAELIEKRDPIYRSADIHVRTDLGLSISATAKCVINAVIEAHPDFLERK